MPTYDYECDACGHEFELFQSISENPKRKCPECKRMKLRRLFGTGAAIMFKGSGFYQTDYRSDSYKKAAEADKKSASETKSENSSSDKKPTESKSSSDTSASETSASSSKAKPKSDKS